MSSMDKGTTWNTSVTQDSKSKKYTISTKDVYIDRNLELTVNVQNSNFDLVAYPSAGGNITLSDDNTSGIFVMANGTIDATTAGWLDSGKTSFNGNGKCVTGVTLPASKQFTINDGLNTWTWTKDSSGNVTII